MKKLFTKKQIVSAIKITVLSAILIVGLNYANAAWRGPTATAPDGNTPAPVNIGTASQIKNGGLGLNALSVFGNGLFTGKATAQRFCFTNGSCVSSWPEACAITETPPPTPTPTVDLTANPTSVAYNGQSTLTWSSTNATSCSANWTSSTATGGTATKSNLTSSQTYTMACTGAGGSAQGSATVIVNVDGGFLIGDVNADGVINCTDVGMILKSVVGTITLTADQKFRADVDGNGIVQSYDASLILQKYNLSCSVGDVNADGVINCTDVSMIQKSVVGTITLTADQKFRADVDGNGIVQSYDASLILQKYNLSCD